MLQRLLAPPAVAHPEADLAQQLLAVQAVELAQGLPITRPYPLEQQNVARVARPAAKAATTLVDADGQRTTSAATRTR